MSPASKLAEGFKSKRLTLVASLLSGGIAECLTLKWAAVRYQHTAAIRGRLLDGYAPATANRILSALRGVLEQTWLFGQMSAEDYHRATRLSPINREVLPAGRELLGEEIAALLQNCMEDPRVIGIRDAAMICIMFGVGLRREEVTTLDMDDCVLEDNKLVIRGKRSKQRTAYIVEEATATLTDWLDIRGRDPGLLFLSVKKGGKLIYGCRMTPRAIYHILATRALPGEQLLQRLA